MFGIPAIFICLVAEIGAARLFSDFVALPGIGNLSHEQGACYLFLLGGGMRVGRFFGSVLVRRMAAGHVLALASVGAYAVMLVAAPGAGLVAPWALVSVGLFHSVTCPTIFTLGIKGLGPLTEEGAGLLIVAIAGRAPVDVQGWLADAIGLQLSVLLSAACELTVLFYAVWGARAGRPS